MQSESLHIASKAGFPVPLSTYMSRALLLCITSLLWLCSNEQSRRCLRDMSMPQELQPSLPRLQVGQALFLWVPDRQRLIGTLCVAEANFGRAEQSGQSGQVRMVCSFLYHSI